MELTTPTRSAVILIFTLFTAVFCKPGTVGQGENGHGPESESEVPALTNNAGSEMQSDKGIIKLSSNLRGMVDAGNSDEEFVANVDRGTIVGGKGALKVDGNVTGGITLGGKGRIIIDGNVEGRVNLTGQGILNIGGNLYGDRGRTTEGNILPR